MELNEVCKHWQELLAPFAEAFAYWAFQRFGDWITGLVLDVEEHTITQSPAPGAGPAMACLPGLGRRRLQVASLQCPPFSDFDARCQRRKVVSAKRTHFSPPARESW
jgi:hypothetical protein